MDRTKLSHLQINTSAVNIDRQEKLQDSTRSESHHILQIELPDSQLNSDADLEKEDSVSTNLDKHAGLVVDDMNQHLKLDGSHYDHREVDQLMSFLDTIEANVSKYFTEDISGQQSLATDHDNLALMQVDKKGNFKLENNSN